MGEIGVAGRDLCGPLCDLCVSGGESRSNGILTTETQRSHRGTQRKLCRTNTTLDLLGEQDETRVQEMGRAGGRICGVGTSHRSVPHNRFCAAN